MKATTLWFVITPKGRLHDPGYNYGMGHRTRRAAIENAVLQHCYHMDQVDGVWGDFKRDGYTVEKRRVS